MASLLELNNSNSQAAIRFLEPLIERAPFIAERVAEKRPFHTCEELFKSIESELHSLDADQRIELFRAHPELAPDTPLTMTKASQDEQGRLGLTNSMSKYKDNLDTLNKQYTATHGFPFITALIRHPDMESVLKEFEARLRETTEAEAQRALNEIATVSAARVRLAFGESSPVTPFGIM